MSIAVRSHPLASLRVRTSRLRTSVVVAAWTFVTAFVVPSVLVVAVGADDGLLRLLWPGAAVVALLAAALQAEVQHLAGVRSFPGTVAVAATVWWATAVVGGTVAAGGGSGQPWGLVLASLWALPYGGLGAVVLGAAVGWLSVRRGRHVAPGRIPRR